jgi:PhnB protein
MTVITALHVNLRGEARAALDFYHSVFGGDLVAMPYGDTPSGQSADQADQIVWGQVSTPSGIRIMAYDVQDALPYDQGTNSFYSALQSTDADEVRAFWDGLSDGAEIEVPFGPAIFSPLYGKLKDRFGVVWIISQTVEYAG